MASKSELPLRLGSPLNRHHPPEMAQGLDQLASGQAKEGRHRPRMIAASPKPCHRRGHLRARVSSAGGGGDANARVAEEPRDH